MTLDEFDGECTKRGYRTMEVGGKPYVVNPTNGQDMPFSADVHQDLLAFHGEQVASDLLEMVLKTLEEGIEKPWFVK